MKIKVCACGHAKEQHYSGAGGCKGQAGDYCVCSHFRYDGAKSFAARAAAIAAGQKGAK